MIENQRTARQIGGTSDSLRAMILAVDAAALAALVTLPLAGLREQLGIALLLAGLAALAGARPVRIAGLRTEVTATHPFVLCALAAWR